jgi:hypothetical protein
MNVQSVTVKDVILCTEVCVKWWSILIIKLGAIIGIITHHINNKNNSNIFNESQKQAKSKLNFKVLGIKIQQNVEQ